MAAESTAASTDPHAPGNAGKAPAVEVRGLSFTYPGSGQGVQDIDLAIAPGEMLVCVGPSGCGKTTLLRLIAGFLQPDRGQILLGGKDQAGRPPRERECGIVFQSYALFPTMSVWENVAYPLRVRGVGADERRRRALELLTLTNLAQHADRMPGALSGGQQQRVALARALVFEPRALLLDEPLSALDATTRTIMRAEILRIQRARGIATLMITHDQDEALSMGDRVAVLRDGLMMQFDTPQRLYDAPDNEFVAGFVGRANLFDATVAGDGTLRTPFGAMPAAAIAGAAGVSAGAVLRMMVRPERIEPAASAENGAWSGDRGEAGTGDRGGVPGADPSGTIWPVKIIDDVFHGATRRVTVQVLGAASGGASPEPLVLETARRSPFDRVRIPHDAVRVLSSNAPASTTSSGA